MAALDIVPPAALDPAMNRAAVVLIVLCLPTGGAVADPDAGAPSAPPLFVVSSDSSKEGAFIDDAFALSADGKSLAYVTTDGAESASLHFVELGGADVVAGAVSPAVVEILWLAPGKVLVVSRDPEPGRMLRAQAFGARGPGRERLGPVDQLALGSVAGRPALLTYARRSGKLVEHVVSAYDRASLRPLGRRSLREDGEGRLVAAHERLRPLWWSDGYATLFVVKPGEFDAARDVRRPDRFARLRLFESALALDQEREIEDVLGFARVASARAQVGGAAQAADRGSGPSDVLVRIRDDRAALELIDGAAAHEVTLDQPLSRYDPATLAYQLLDETRLLVSLTIDPVNPDAVARKKADADLLEVYEVDRHTRVARRIVQIAAKGRPLSWRAAADRLVVLRKSRGFDRGGVRLEVHPLPLAAAAQASVPR